MNFRKKRLDQERELQVRQALLLQEELDHRTKDLMTDCKLNVNVMYAMFTLYK